MTVVTEKARLLAVLNKQPHDRPPVICPGGMMNAAIVDVTTSSGQFLPAAHADAALMAKLAAAVHHHTGFENFGLPFCMTVEAEVLGSEIDLGTRECEPKISREAYASAAQVEFKDIRAMLTSGRIPVVCEATSILSAQYPDIPVVGSLTGPVSTAASIVDPVRFLKDLYRDAANAHHVFDYVTELLSGFAYKLIDHGAAAIAIADPTATGEILGPKMFANYAVTYINKLVTAIHQRGVPVIIHICGNVNSVKSLLPKLKADAVSTDAIVNLKLLKDEFPELTTMGNVSTYLLELGSAEKVTIQTKNLLEQGINIIAPACGLSTSSPLINIQSLTQTVKAIRTKEGG
ncbi:uroporphyrinogen decarboxylase family protein [Sporomusa acidovorans]|uniref:Uroporphyrinogen decarboxylase n=1 Tax=Sporomusa acidovorans (strain ATCC 49682 / DSM 3132 / Mol) TaxID=1123286 RepID=A0ABZ3IYR5_SPOA4|nr:uroporphyrinogen decarboxylase family protein [Sporomusa acidovorans]OZC16865.1 uroporphyrinogen decarboxylase [Sporomusa acidovorans DSM 3132]SDF24669.1 [methyl-Co(III) methanol-specific corrinoid protein]:coenzyme M methyltransferase [Sporomusa acidovorans]